MLYKYFTEKLLGLQDVDIEKVEEKILYQDLNRLWLDMKNKITK